MQDLTLVFSVALAGGKLGKRERFIKIFGLKIERNIVYEKDFAGIAQILCKDTVYQFRVMLSRRFNI
jgi:hypothetical protein